MGSGVAVGVGDGEGDGVAVAVGVGCRLGWLTPWSRTSTFSGGSLPSYWAAVFWASQRRLGSDRDTRTVRSNRRMDRSMDRRTPFLSMRSDHTLPHEKKGRMVSPEVVREAANKTGKGSAPLDPASFFSFLLFPLVQRGVLCHK